MSTPLPEPIALEALLYRALNKLRTHFSTELATVNAAATSASLPTVPTPVPDASNYYLGIGIAQVEKILTNANVAVFVFPAAPSEDLEILSGSTPTEEFVNVGQSIQVLIAYRIAMSEPTIAFGKTMSSWDIMATRGMRYNAAVTRIFRTKMVGGAGITIIDGSDSLPGDTRLSEDGDPIIGYASTVWNFDQYVKRPMGCEV